MKKLLVLLLSGVLCLSLAACGDKKAEVKDKEKPSVEDKEESKLKEYKHDATGLKFVAPIEWESTDLAGAPEGTLSYFIIDKEGGNVLLGGMEAPGASVEDFNAAVLATLNAGGITEVNTANETVGSRNFILNSYNFQGETTMSVLQAVFVEEGVGYTLSLSATEANVAKYQEAFENLIKSIKF